MGRRDLVKSFTAADELPVKLLRDWDMVRSAGHQVLIPRHIQLIPTNRCNLDCEFCSCADEDRELILDTKKVQEVINKLGALGTRAVTITGGGEPFLHPNILGIVDKFVDNGIEVGMVTNGTLFNTSRLPMIPKLRWIRVSMSDDRTFYPEKMPSKGYYRVVDWAFSYVVTKKANINNIVRVIDFANRFDFSHVRVVADIFNADRVEFNRLQMEVMSRVECTKVIFQPRNEPRQGGPCYIGFVKPIIHANGLVYTCCGAQYAIEGAPRRMPEELCLGDIDNFVHLLKHPPIRPFNGRICDVCFYTDYNKVLSMLLDGGIIHKRFI